MNPIQNISCEEEVLAEAPTRCTVCNYVQLPAVHFELTKGQPMCAFCAAYFHQGNSDSERFALAVADFKKQLSEIELLGAYADFAQDALDYHTNMRWRCLEAKVKVKEVMRDALRHYVLHDHAEDVSDCTPADAALQIQAADWVWEQLLWEQVLADVEVAAVLTDHFEEMDDVEAVEQVLAHPDVNRLWSLWLLSNYCSGTAQRQGMSQWHWRGARHLQRQGLPAPKVPMFLGE
jgi:hypothetical protein